MKIVIDPTIRYTQAELPDPFRDLTTPAAQPPETSDASTLSLIQVQSRCALGGESAVTFRVQKLVKRH